METPQLPQPSQSLVYVVIWRHTGLWLVRAFSDFDEARQVFDGLIQLARVNKPIDQDYAVYLLYWLAGYTYNDY